MFFSIKDEMVTHRFVFYVLILSKIDSFKRNIFRVPENIRLNRLCWFGHIQRTEENRIPKRVLYMNLGTTRLRGRPRNRWQDEVREDGRIVGREGWQEKVHNRVDGRSSWERQGIVEFCTCQWNEWMNEWIRPYIKPSDKNNKYRNNQF